MAFNAQFFQANPQKDFGDLYSKGLDNYEKNYKFQKEKTLNDIFSESTKSDGSFDTEGFLTKTSAAGIGKAATEQWLGQKGAKSDAAVKEAQNAGVMDLLGRKPDVLRDWFEQEKAKKENTPIATTTTPTPEPAAVVKSVEPSQTQVVDKPKVSEQLEQLIKPKPTETPTTSATSDMEVETKLTADSGWLPTPDGKTSDPGTYDMAPKADTLMAGKKYDIVEESLRREPGQSIQEKMGGSTSTGFASDSTNWEPADDGTNEYRQYRTALDSQLKANGLGSTSDYLKKIGESTYKQNIYIPNQLAYMSKDGKIDYAAYGAEIAKQKESEIKAQAKAEEAIQNAKDKLMETAQKYGVSTIASKEEGRNVEKQEADMQGRRPEGYQYRYVTPTEATKGRDLVSSYFDIRDGLKRGGFDGAYAAALAKAKADGSVNSDAIVGNLVAMGAIPSNKAIYIKSLLNPGGSVTTEGAKQIASFLGTSIEKFNESGVAKQWGNDAVSNIKETAKMYGYDLDKGTTKPPPPPGNEPKKEPTPAAKFSGAKPSDKPKKTGWYKDADGVMRNHK